MIRQIDIEVEPRPDDRELLIDRSVSKSLLNIV